MSVQLSPVNVQKLSLIHILYSLAVAYLDVVAILVLADGLHHVGAGVVQGVFQKVHTVIVTVIPLSLIHI